MSIFGLLEKLTLLTSIDHQTLGDLLSPDTIAAEYILSTDASHLKLVECCCRG
jgi:hypothetical protein